MASSFLYNVVCRSTGIWLVEENNAFSANMDIYVSYSVALIVANELV